MMTVNWGGIGFLWNKPVLFIFIRPDVTSAQLLLRFCTKLLSKLFKLPFVIILFDYLFYIINQYIKFQFVEAGMKYSDKSIIKNPDLSYSNDELKLNVLVNYIKQIIE